MPRKHRRRIPQEILDILLGDDTASMAGDVDYCRTGTFDHYHVRASATSANGNAVGGDGIYTARACPTCGCTCDGIEPLYTLAVAAEAVPFPSRQHLIKWLSKRRAEFRTFIRKHGWTKMRMIPQGDVFRIREVLMKPYSYGSGRPLAHPIGRVLRDSAVHQKQENQAEALRKLDADGKGEANEQ